MVVSKGVSYHGFIYSDGRKSNLPIVFDASGIDANKLAVPEASLVCLSFRANSQFCVRIKLYAYQYPIDIPCGYFWLAWSSLVLVLKPCWLKRMNKFTVLRYLNFVAENLGVEFFKVGINCIYLFDIEPVGKAVGGVLAFGGQSN
ncbi:hypothetical protein PVK06_005200 [Gossypium arboreum]|uniref:Uncharacterized protein n=1 Tax=Gossypium arboreum TaxID=29729 RepID=A0ABR0QUE4_GOSAR|nr:hypothetical protein PVK06_005200 [Gossypium arboreum]